MTEPTTIASLIARGTRQLDSGNTTHDSAALDAQLLLAQALGIERWRLLAHTEAAVDAAAAERYRRLLCRRAAGEPLGYLTGRREFWSLEFMVTADVLIPRPETELLVERALALRNSSTGRVADLGTGCGALAIALARERPGWQIVATDVSAAALSVAQRNAQALGVSIALRQGTGTPRSARKSSICCSATHRTWRRTTRRCTHCATSRARRSPPAATHCRACARWCAAQHATCSPGLAAARARRNPGRRGPR